MNLRRHQARQQRRRLIAGQARGFDGVVGGVGGGLLGREQSLQLIPQSRDAAFRIGKVAIRGGVQDGEEAAERVAGRRDDGLRVAAIHFQREGGGEEAQALFKSPLMKPARAAAGVQTIQASKGARPGAATLAVSGSTG